LSFFDLGQIEVARLLGLRRLYVAFIGKIKTAPSIQPKTSRVVDKKDLSRAVAVAAAASLWALFPPQCYCQGWHAPGFWLLAFGIWLFWALID
jgi:hypothetical protein